MSATDELRRMLDERGVEWTASGTDTCWTSADGYPMRAWDTTNGTHMRVADLTPEQAIAATLGAGMCRNVETCKLNELDALTQTLSMANGCAWSECSECGCLTPDDSTYCINCGRKVER